MDMSALIQDPFEMVVAFFQNASMVDMISRLDGSWYESFVAPEFFRAAFHLRVFTQVQTTQNSQRSYKTKKSIIRRFQFDILPPYI